MRALVQQHLARRSMSQLRMAGAMRAVPGPQQAFSALPAASSAPTVRAARRMRVMASQLLSTSATKSDAGAPDPLLKPPPAARSSSPLDSKTAAATTHASRPTPMPAPAAAPRPPAPPACAPRPPSSSGYRQPPPEILQIVDAPPQPSLSFSPDRKLILQLQRPPSLPPIAEIARPELKLAGEQKAADAMRLHA